MMVQQEKADFGHVEAFDERYGPFQKNCNECRQTTPIRSASVDVALLGVCCGEGYAEGVEFQSPGPRSAPWVWNE